VSGSYGSSITIEEITGSRRWSVTLVGAGLPRQGLAFGASNRVPTEFYPGNFAQATQQVIGPKEDPSRMEGIWRRTMLLRSPATITPGGSDTLTATPTTLWTFLETLLLGGARLQVTWTATKTEQIPNASPGGTTTAGNAEMFQVVRVGRAAKWTFTPLTMDDVKWEIEWAWSGRGGTQQAVVATRDGDDSAAAAAVQSSLQDALNLVGQISPSSSATPLVPLSASIFTLGVTETISPVLTGLFAGFNTSLISIQTSYDATGDVSDSTDGDPVQLQASVLNLTSDTMVTCNGFTDSVGEVPFELMSTSDDVGDIAMAADAAAQAVEAAWNARAAAQAAFVNAQLLASANPGGGTVGQTQTQAAGAASLLAVYRTCDGDTPQRVAMRYYGDADRAYDLLQANHLPLGTPSFPTGTVLMIPVLRSSASS
jgi:phage tail protein X